MPTKLQEIEGVFRQSYARRGEWMAGTISDYDQDNELSINGEADADELVRGLRYRFYGRFTEFRGERQFKFQTFVPAVAHDKAGVIEYLVRAGKGLGFGKGTAAKVWSAYGSDSVRIIRNMPSKLTAYSNRITLEQCEQIGKVLASQKATEDATIDVTNLLVGRGLPKTTGRKAIKLWGNKAAEIIRRDPFALMRFRGCGFRLCDTLWIELGLSPERLKRQSLCAWHTIKSNSEGHCWHPVELAMQGVRQNIGSANARPVDAIKLAVRLGRISPTHYGALTGRKTDGKDGALSDNGTSGWVAEASVAKQEQELAEMVAAALAERGKNIWPEASTIAGIDAHQQGKLSESLVSRVAILSGSPGSGKTYTTAMLIKALLKSGQVGPGDIAIGAPTGKAAVRLTEALQAAGVNLTARTWHSLLGAGEAGGEGSAWAFEHGKKNPWPFRVLIGDESPMMDVSLMHAVFSARPRGCHVLLVGDINQLPPVGAGAPLRDMIASQCIGYGELTEIKRNSGGIVEACAAIRDGVPWVAGDNLIVDEQRTPAAQMDAMVSRIKQAAADGHDPVWDCQVLVAVNARSKLSRKFVNERLQAELNPNEKIEGSPFRLADKIVCLQNGKYQEIDEYGAPMKDAKGEPVECDVANGELARVTEVAEKTLTAELSNPCRVIRVPRGKPSGGDSEDAGSGCNWDLAYGLSGHKGQGSEWPIGITLIDEYPGAKMVCCREWLYTNLSRAKAKAIVIGRKSTADAMCRRVAIGKRKTFLRELIQLEVANNAMEMM